MANLTLSADDEVITKARRVAQRQGKSLNEMVRSYLGALAGQEDGTDPAAELLDLLREQPGRSDGRQFGRREIYEDRIDTLASRRT